MVNQSLSSRCFIKSEQSLCCFSLDDAIPVTQGFNGEFFPSGAQGRKEVGSGSADVQV
jgi:hypothetical protein